MYERSDIKAERSITPAVCARRLSVDKNLSEIIASSEMQQHTTRDFIRSKFKLSLISNGIYEPCITYAGQFALRAKRHRDTAGIFQPVTGIISKIPTAVEIFPLFADKLGTRILLPRYAHYVQLRKSYFSGTIIQYIFLNFNSQRITPL